MQLSRLVFPVAFLPSFIHCAPQSEPQPIPTCTAGHSERPAASVKATQKRAALPEYNESKENERDRTCHDVQIITTRGTLEKDPDHSFLDPLSNMVLAENPGAYSWELGYWATWGNNAWNNAGNNTGDQTETVVPSYVSSSMGGTWLLRNETKTLVERCPKTKIVLMGFSQGAHVILDALCGGGSANDNGQALTFRQTGPWTCPLDSKYQSNIIAITVFGDPRRAEGPSYNRGTSEGPGMLERVDPQTCSKEMEDKIRSYCDEGDFYCDKGSDEANEMVHSKDHYEPLYFNEAAEFIQGKIEAAKYY